MGLIVVIANKLKIIIDFINIFLQDNKKKIIKLIIIKFYKKLYIYFFEINFKQFLVICSLFQFIIEEL